MAGTYEPYHPLFEPKPVADGLWVMDGPLVPYSVGPFEIPCPTRMTLIELGRGAMLVHSPIALTREASGGLSRIGHVAAILAPNSFHHLHVAPWANAFPKAPVFTAPHMPAKADLPSRASVIDETSGSPWPGLIDIEVVDAGRWSELALLHRPTKTLILTDLIQNFEEDRVTGGMTKLLLSFGGTLGNPPRASRDMQFSARLGGHWDELRRSLQRIKEWAPERVLFAHGTSPETPAEELLERGFAWAG